MKRLASGFVLAVFVLGQSATGRADEKDALAIIDKAVKALGGEEKLAKIKAATWKTKGKLHINGNDNDFKTESSHDGLDHFRSQFEGEFNGNSFTAVTVLAGDKAWRKFGDMVMELDADALKNEKRTVYLQVVPTTLLHLKTKDFKVETAGEEKVGDKPAAVIKATGPDGKSFKLSFDKETSLPARLVADVVGFGGEEFTQETLFSAYKTYDGVQHASKVESKRDGEPFIEIEVTEYKPLDKLPAETFAEPK